MKRVRWFVALALAANGSALAQAPKFPVKPVRMIVGFAPGGATDIIARSIASGMTETLGQQVIVENRPGASSQIAGDLVAKSPPDGHTLMMVTQTLMTSAMIERKTYPDLVKDFSHVALTATSTLMLVVTPSLPVKSIKELIALARSRPGDLTYASGGVGTTPHLAGELLITMARLKMVHVPYKGEAPGLIDVIGGHVPMMFTNISASSGFVKDGRLRALAVTSLKPTPAMPGLPSLAESGLPGFEVIGFFGVLAPAGTSRDAIVRLNSEINKALARPEVAKNFAAQALEPQNKTPEQFSDYIKSEAGKWGKLIQEAGIK
ncbi:MAG TPA: tripartite tricarboxylate transporter substrate binding protein [Burkholderiales bacterium]|nr:tripartite tricarboxylate transporter substrate binding protein [Burkholderiales bacterium]